MAPAAGVACLAFGSTAWPLVAVACGLAMLGLADDLRPRSARLRLGLQIAAGSSLAIWILDHSGLVIAVLVLVFCCGYVNATNFMDGINGITGLHALVVGLCFAYVGWDHSSAELAAAGGALAGAALGFLPINFPTARAFPGDSGSYLVGGWIAGLVALAIHQQVGLIAAGGATAIYIVDTGCVVVRRAVRRERLTEPHRQHVYQRLVDNNRTHTSVALTVAVFTLAGFIGGYFVTEAAVSVGVLLCLGMFYLALPNLPVKVARAQPTGEL